MRYSKPVSQAELEKIRQLYKKGLNPNSAQLKEEMEKVKQDTKEKYDLRLAQTRGDQIKKEIDKNSLKNSTVSANKQEETVKSSKIKKM